jgi:hypothetical protein
LTDERYYECDLFWDGVSPTTGNKVDMVTFFGLIIVIMLINLLVCPQPITSVKVSSGAAGLT